MESPGFEGAVDAGECHLRTLFDRFRATWRGGQAEAAQRAFLAVRNAALDHFAWERQHLVAPSRDRRGPFHLHQVIQRDSECHGEIRRRLDEIAPLLHGDRAEPLGACIEQLDLLLDFHRRVFEHQLCAGVREMDTPLSPEGRGHV